MVGTIAALALAVFLVDLALPLVVAVAVLYGGVVLLAGAVAGCRPLRRLAALC
jgi:hypothetical protein